ncbi:methyl-accepting chemotaxis protein ['Massilia aquatica' Lu et al. 2020]|uniref:HAMP domain-containing protein n=1 Tax=Pseudoduganella aquatica TaxID=2660641 RepID=A0A7X4H9F1_9BURK|nr:methyl-accepting chemotaxis protein [Pseudoduganella aquatica]MYN06137.1 HAMP domain-containing protein [Pseudoduganella aquatica]
MFTKTTIRLRLISTMALLGLLIVGTGLSGLHGMNTINASLRDVNTNTMPSAVAILNSQLSLSRARLAMDRVTMHPEDPDAAKTLQRAASFVADSDKAWSLYLTLPQGADEKVLSDEMDSRRRKFIDEGFQPLVAAAKAGDAAKADAITMKTMQPLFTSLSESAAKLTDYQARSNMEQFDASQAMYRQRLWFTLGAIAGGVLLMLIACVSLLRSILRPINEAVNHFNSIAGGDLSNRISVDGHDEMSVLMRGLAGMQAKLAALVRGVRDGTASIATATHEIAEGNLDLSRRTEQQAASLEETASSLEELTATVQQNSARARQSNQLAQAASEIAVKGGALVGGVIGTMGAIRESSTRIQDIIGVIDGIAFQTNILALNAAVEAARAGEQGRGFAVVASEVRSLAHRSAEAAKDIKTLIGDSVAKVDSGGQQVGEAGATMEEIVSSIRRVADIMGEIAAAGHEQEMGIGQINVAVAELDDVTQQNAALVEEAAAASESLKEQAEKLADVASAFRVDGVDDGGGAGKAVRARRPVVAGMLQRA